MTRNFACHLFQRCLDERDGEPWNQFDKRYGSYLKGVVWRTVRQHRIPLLGQDLEDLVQDLICRVLAGRRPRVLEWSDSQLWSYFSRIAFRLLVDRHRTCLLHRKALALCHREGVELQWVKEPRVVAGLPTPEELALRRDDWRQLGVLARQIAHPGRRSLEIRGLRMALLEGYSSREIAELTGGRLNCRRVNRLVFRFRQKLADAGLGVVPRRLIRRRRMHQGPHRILGVSRRRTS